MKYTEKEFKEKVLSMKPWIKEIKENFINTKQKMTVVCHNGHENTILAASLVREGRLNQCQKCRVETEEDYKKHPKLCEYCGKPIKFDTTANYTRAKKFCSQSCSAKKNNSKRAEKKVCLNCGKELKSRYQKKFCDIKCQNDYKYNN